MYLFCSTFRKLNSHVLLFWPVFSIRLSYLRDILRNRELEEKTTCSLWMTMNASDYSSISLLSEDRAVVDSPLTITPETSIEKAIAQMDKAHTSYAVVLERQRPVGYFSGRELIKLYASRQLAESVGIASVMTADMPSLAVSELTDTACILRSMQQAEAPLSVVDSEGALVGSITHQSIVQALRPTEIRQAFEDLQRQVEQLLAENQRLMESCSLLGDRTAQNPDAAKASDSAVDPISFDQIKDDFIAIVSHELRTPLTAIHGGIKLLSQGLVVGQSERGQALLQVVAQNSQRLVRLVNDILDIEYLASAKSPLDLRPCNTQTITHQISETFQLIANEKAIELVIHDLGFEVICDSDRLGQVLTNLLDNAVKFSPANSTIHLRVEPSEAADDGTLADGMTDTRSPNTNRYVRFSVCDEGQGIPAEQCSRIFERFTQADASDTRQQGGTGLGLAICRSIVEQHGGHIWVESTVGEGSCFYFTIPAPQPPA